MHPEHPDMHPVWLSLRKKSVFEEYKQAARRFEKLNLSSAAADNKLKHTCLQPAFHAVHLL